MNLEKMCLNLKSHVAFEPVDILIDNFSRKLHS